jgi:hypothetical protein
MALFETRIDPAFTPFVTDVKISADFELMLYHLDSAIHAQDTLRIKFCAEVIRNRAHYLADRADALNVAIERIETA